MRREEGFECFFDGLLTMKQGVFNEGRVRGQIHLAPRRSLAALCSQARTSCACSGRIEEEALAFDGGREGRDDAAPAFKLFVGQHDDILGRANSREKSEGLLVAPIARLRGLGDDDKEIVVTIGGGGTSGVRPEQINAFGVQGLTESEDHLSHEGVHCRGRRQHGYA